MFSLLVSIFLARYKISTLMRIPVPCWISHQGVMIQAMVFSLFRQDIALCVVILRGDAKHTCESVSPCGLREVKVYIALVSPLIGCPVECQGSASRSLPPDKGQMLWSLTRLYTQRYRVSSWVEGQGKVMELASPSDPLRMYLVGARGCGK